MPSPYFEFKKFRIYHDRCAMKVGTDGVLVAAWTRISDVESILDIGTGSGLIAMMVAQRTNFSVCIDAIDLDKEAVEQAKENVLKACLKAVNVFQSDLKMLDDSKKYDLIISNPPFFSSSLHSPNHKRTMARHTDSLPINDLISYSTRLLSQRGRISVIYPYECKTELVTLADQHQLYVSRITNVYPTPTAQPKRILMEFSKVETICEETDLVIELKRHIYSDDFISLAKDFYLKL